MVFTLKGKMVLGKLEISKVNKVFLRFNETLENGVRMDFSSYLSRIKKIYAEMELDLIVNPGAKEAIISSFEESFGHKLDPDLRKVWLTIDGSEDFTSPLFCRPGYYTGLSLLPISKASTILNSLVKAAPNYNGYKESKPRDPRIDENWFPAGWLPFASFGGSTILLMQDYSPSSLGKIGQVISYTHDPDGINFIAESFSEFLDASLADLEGSPEEYFLFS
jgi:cell wall assembly regulator SMI1